jgi:PAS domain S-box-containing protein
MSGASPSEIVGRRFHDFVSVPDHPILDAILDKEGLDRPKAEIRLGKGPDADLPAQIAASPVELGGAKALALVITDLSAQRRYEEIVAAEKLSRRILEQAREAIAVCINGCIVRANRAFYEICGSFPLMQPFDLVFPLRISESEMFSAAMPESGKAIQNQEVRYERPDGKSFDLVLSAGPLVGKGNKILGSLVSLVDVTARKRAEEALLESEKRMRLLGDNLPDSAVYQYVHELDGSVRYLYFSAGIERLNGVSVEDVLRDAGALHRQIPPEYKTRLVEVEARSKQDLSDFDMEVPMRRPDGELRWMRLHSRPRRMPDGRTIWDGVQSDITERKQAEERLRESETRFREMAETVPDILFTTLPAGSIDYINERGLDYAGMPAGEAMRGGWLKAVHPQDIERSVGAIKESLRTGEPYEVMQRFRAADGSYRWFLVRARAIRDEKGEILKWFGNATDIHDMVMAEEALRASDEQFWVLIQNMQSAVALINEHGALMIVNRSFLRMFELAEFVPQGFPRLAKALDRDLPRGMLPDTRHPRARRDGTCRRAIRPSAAAFRAVCRVPVQ